MITTGYSWIPFTTAPVFRWWPPGHPIHLRSRQPSAEVALNAGENAGWTLGNSWQFHMFSLVQAGFKPPKSPLTGLRIFSWLGVPNTGGIDMSGGSKHQPVPHSYQSSLLNELKPRMLLMLIFHLQDGAQQYHWRSVDVSDDNSLKSDGFIKQWSTGECCRLRVMWLIIRPLHLWIHLEVS